MLLRRSTRLAEPFCFIYYSEDINEKKSEVKWHVFKRRHAQYLMCILLHGSSRPVPSDFCLFSLTFEKCGKAYPGKPLACAESEPHASIFPWKSPTRKNTFVQSGTFLRFTCFSLWWNCHTISIMETFLTGAGNNDDLFSNQNGCSYSKLPRFVHGKKVNNNESFTSVEEDSSDILVSEGDGSGSEMDITEDYPSETRAITRKDSTFCVPLIRVEDWSFSESDMEDDLEDSLPPFSFVGTKEKVKVYSVFIFYV